VPRHGTRRVATRLLTVAAVVSLAGCGKPANLDHQEQVAFARECTSLVERNLSGDTPPRRGSLGGENVNLDEPSSFYSILERIRGASTYNLHDPKHNADVGRQPLDNCDAKAPLLSSLLTRPGTTGASTTSTTRPRTATGN
jgi:hypothetical protein